MHTISHLIEPERLLLVWQDPKGRDRQRLVVGALRRAEDGHVTFAYLHNTDDFRIARKLGFRGYPDFPNFEEVYRRDVLSAFLRRLPPRTRLDFYKYLETLRLPREVRASLSDFALLGYSGAKLPSDGFSLVHPFDHVDNDCEILLEVAGFRYQQVSIEDLQFGDTAEFIPEPQNRHHNRAIRIEVNGRCIGYVNRVQVEAFHYWLKQGRSIRAWVERKNGRPDRPLVYLFVKIRNRQAQVAPLLAM